MPPARPPQTIEMKENVSSGIAQHSRSHTERWPLPTDHCFYRLSDPARVVAQSHGPPAPAQLRARIPHDNWMPGKLKHFHIVVIVTDGHDLFPPNPAKRRPPLQRMSLRTSRIKHVNHRQIP